MTKIFWKKEEEHAVALAAGRLLESKEEKHIGRAIIRGQQIALPSDRWRSETSLGSSVHYFRDLIKLVMEAENARTAELREQHEREEQRRREEEAQHEANRLREEQEEREAEERGRARSLQERDLLSQQTGLDLLDVNPENLMQPDFIGNLVRAMGSNFENALVAELSKAAQRAHLRVAATLHQQVKTFEELPKIQPNRPKVVVVGFKGHLNHEIYKEYNEFFEFAFFDPEANLKLVASAAAMADHVLVIKKFCGHRHSDLLSSHKGFKLIIGSITSAKDYLQELAITSDDQNKS